MGLLQGSALTRDTQQGVPLTQSTLAGDREKKKQEKDIGGKMSLPSNGVLSRGSWQSLL